MQVLRYVRTPFSKIHEHQNERLHDYSSAQWKKQNMCLRFCIILFFSPQPIIVKDTCFSGLVHLSLLPWCGDQVSCGLSNWIFVFIWTQFIIARNIQNCLLKMTQGIWPSTPDLLSSVGSLPYISSLFCSTWVKDLPSELLQDSSGERSIQMFINTIFFQI